MSTHKSLMIYVYIGAPTVARRGRLREGCGVAHSQAVAVTCRKSACRPVIRKRTASIPMKWTNNHTGVIDDKGKNSASTVMVAVYWVRFSFCARPGQGPQAGPFPRPKEACHPLAQAVARISATAKHRELVFICTCVAPQAGWVRQLEWRGTSSAHKGTGRTLLHFLLKVVCRTRTDLKRLKLTTATLPFGRHITITTQRCCY